MVIFLRLFIFVIIFYTGIASAETRSDKCSDDTYVIVGQELNIKNFRQEGSVVSETCKIWPSNDNILLAAFAYGVGDQNLEDPTMAVFVAMINIKTKHIISSYRTEVEQDALTQFAQNSLWLDTARYQLAKDVKAFGLQFTSLATGPSCAEGGRNDELILFVPEGNKLRVVFDYFTQQQKSISGECGDDSHVHYWQTAMLTFGIEKTSTNGFHNLVTTARITNTGNMKEHIEHYVLRYDGKTYKTGNSQPWWLDNTDSAFSGVGAH